MILTDTHSHLYAEEFDGDRDEALRRADEEGVTRLLLPAIDSTTHERLFALCRRDPRRYIPMMGLHPTSVNDLPQWREELALVEHYLENPPEGVGRFCAVGEIGLDLYWSREHFAEQLEAFERQLEMALKHDLPVAMHIRDAWDEVLEVMERFRGRGLRGVFHAFSDGVETYRRLRECGDFRFGIGGVVTFKKAGVAEVVAQMNLEDIVLETDCPYLTPVPFRGRRNESSYVKYVCRKVAEVTGTDEERVAEVTTRTAARMFGFEVPSCATDGGETTRP